MGKIILFLLSFQVSADASFGRKVYRSRCISCHHTDPRKKGSVGPELHGSSLELVTLKTQQRKYPEGYKPKRKTRIMPIIKLTESELNGIYKFVNSLQ